MSKVFKILKISFILILIVIVNACAPAKKNPYYQKRKKASHVNTSQLGRNRYFYSPSYQKKLIKSYKRKN
jgi:hypothetical protein